MALEKVILAIFALFFPLAPFLFSCLFLRLINRYLPVRLILVLEDVETSSNMLVLLLVVIPAVLFTVRLIVINPWYKDIIIAAVVELIGSILTGVFLYQFCNNKRISRIIIVWVMLIIFFLFFILTAYDAATHETLIWVFILVGSKYIIQTALPLYVVLCGCLIVLQLAIIMCFCYYKFIGTSVFGTYYLDKLDDVKSILNAHYFSILSLLSGIFLLSNGGSLCEYLYTLWEGDNIIPTFSSMEICGILICILLSVCFSAFPFITLPYIFFKYVVNRDKLENKQLVGITIYVRLQIYLNVIFLLFYVIPTTLFTMNIINRGHFMVQGFIIAGIYFYLFLLLLGLFFCLVWAYRIHYRKS
ncbi:MAG TPA: hypothetical protein VN704_11715, partial [Verrucomicrobiae bacterium]|nr:hypothetical protein [Verrucomicrobiae bacterium]